MNDNTSTNQLEEQRPLLRRQTLTVEEFAVLVGVGRSTAYEAARRGEIPARRVGKRFVVPVELARAWLGEVACRENSLPAHWQAGGARHDPAEPGDGGA